ncbi:restriction endonuclease subunit S [Candidatus Bipolaricaulota bacterium]|nr:restriction endonuclease subunit S [Candidatus Bipolaricaulota bacterium]
MKVETVRLGEVADVMAGQPAPQEPRVFGKRGLPFIRAGHLSGLQESSYPDQRIDEHLGSSLGLKRVANGSVLFAKSGMSATKGIVVTLECDAYLVSHVCGITPSDELDSRFLMYWLRWQPPFHLIRDSAYPSIRLEDVRALRVPLPPLPEQRQIAAILDKADAIRRKRQQTLNLTDQFLRSAFLDMFGDPVTNPKHWPVKKLGEFADIRSGITKGRKLGDAETITVPYMRVANVQDGRLELADIKTIKIRPDELGRYSLTTGDVLLTEGGDPDKLGRGAVWAGAVDPCVHQNHIFSVRVDRSIAEPHFISALIGSAYGKRHFLRIGKQTTGIATINKTQLSSFPALLPPIKIQKQYAAIVARFDGGLGRLTRTLAKHEELSKSLTQRAFRGEL